MASCATPNVTYLQDVQNGEEYTVAATEYTQRIKADDNLSIAVSSKNPELAALFNLTKTNTKSAATAVELSTGVGAYTVNKDGSVDFPILGKVQVAGKTREEIATMLKTELVSRNLVNDAVVTVTMPTQMVSVLGEVTRPGRVAFDKSQLTLLDAIATCGDLTINGKRENILVQRSEEGKQKIYRVNLQSGKDLYASPVYYLQPGDVVYVEPNASKARQSTTNGNTLKSATFWISVASVIASISTLVVYRVTK